MKRLALAIAALTALFVALRVPGLDARLPHAPEPDAKLVYQAADPPERGKYPFLWVAALAATGAVDPTALDSGASLEARLDEARRPLRSGRLMVLLVSSLAVPATWLLGRRLLTPRAALLATALTAVGPIWTLYAGQARPHALAASLACLAVVPCAAVVRRSSASRQFAAALAVGIAAASFHAGLLVAPSYAASLVASRPRGRALVGALVGMVLATLLVAWSYAPGPEADLTPGLSRTAKRFGAAAVEEHSDGALRVSGHAVYPGLFDGGGAPLLANLLRSNDPSLLVLAPAGLLVLGLGAARRRARAEPRAAAPRTPLASPAERLVIAAHPLTVLAVFGLYSGSWERFFVPLLPYLALLAARALQPLVGLGGSWAALVAAAALALPSATTARLTWLRTQPDSSERIASWIAGHVDPNAGTILLTSGEELPLLRREVPPDQPGRRTVSWINRQSDHPRPTGELTTWPLADPDQRYPRRMARAALPDPIALELLDAARPRYVLLTPENVRNERYIDPAPDRALARAVHARGGRLLVRVDPVRPCASGRRGLDSYLGPAAARDLWCIDFLGPPLELWELPGPWSEAAR